MSTGILYCVIPNLKAQTENISHILQLYLLFQAKHNLSNFVVWTNILDFAHKKNLYCSDLPDMRYDSGLKVLPNNIWLLLVW